MAETLHALLAAAKRLNPTPEQRAEQRRSSAFGNTSYENPRIARDMIDRQAEKLDTERKADGRNGS